MTGRWWRRLTGRHAELLLADCDRCGHASPAWVAVCWQHERNDDRGGIEPTGSDLLGLVCPGCAAVVQDDVLAAVARVLWSCPDCGRKGPHRPVPGTPGRVECSGCGGSWEVSS